MRVSWIDRAKARSCRDQHDVMTQHRINIFGRWSIPAKRPEFFLLCFSNAIFVLCHGDMLHLVWMSWIVAGQLVEAWNKNTRSILPNQPIGRVYKSLWYQIVCSCLTSKRVVLFQVSRTSQWLCPINDSAIPQAGVYVHWASKETYHFFRVTFTRIHCIKTSHIWTQIRWSTP